MSETLQWIVGQIVVAAAIWGSIRADIKGMHQRMDDIKDSVDKAHTRLDIHFQNMRRRKDDDIC